MRPPVCFEKVWRDRWHIVFDLFVQGIFISRVSAEGPAARAGVKVGDKLLEVNILLTPSFLFLCLRDVFTGFYFLSVFLRWMEWTSMRRNTTQLWKLCEAPAPRFLWPCYGSTWWNQRTPSPPRRWGLKTTTSPGRGVAAAWPSTWSPPPADLSSDSTPAWSEMTRGWDSASPVAKAPRLTVQETWWDSRSFSLVIGYQKFQNSVQFLFRTNVVIVSNER